ncbi:unnamed protein product [Oikopleura dioica]|uniref:Carboxylic ester hydrolase n=1 Tax=Oikopleura dioica TaxID=34765 RepID=E4YP15_OIKDI|nr:unnamed protein product [Oikopleura dioica]
MSWTRQALINLLKVYGDICRQVDWGSEESSGSEDCLTLNILVPDSLDGQDSPRAVMIWIHGGAFVTATQSHYTDGRALALHEDVIVVNINYRLGTVGFLSGIDDAHSLGNFGVRDQQVAIEWVSRNIADFGGDPERINIFGCSAGGRSVGAQLVTPKNDGLIFSAIGQSGDISSDLIWDNFAEDNINAVLENTNCTDESTRLECLRSVDIDVLQRAADTSKAQNREWQWGLVVDGDFFVDRCGMNMENSDESCLRRHAQVKFMSGCCSADGYGFAPAWTRRDGEGSIEKIRLSIEAITDFTIPFGYRNESLEVAKLTYRDWENPWDEYQIRNLTIEAETDWRYCAPTVNLHRDRSTLENKDETFLYYFDVPSQLSGGMQGANHCADNKFQFGHPILNPISTPADKLLSRQMMRYWANMAKFGSPNDLEGAGDLPNWEAFNPERRNFFRIDHGVLENENNFRSSFTATWIDSIRNVEDLKSDA